MGMPHLASTALSAALWGWFAISPAHAALAQSKAARSDASWRDAAVNALAARGDARALATAALLRIDAGAMNLGMRAANLAPDDTTIGWVTLRVCALTPGCDIRGYATELRWLDPNNSAAWLPTLAGALRDQDSVEIDRVLAHMARGTSVDFYWNPIVVMMFDALQAVSGHIPGRAVDSDAARLAVVERLAAAEVIPPLTPLVSACRDAKPGTPRRASCTTIAKILQRSDTVNAEYAGFAIARRYAPYQGREYRALTERRRVLMWRVATAAQFDSPLLPWLKSAHARWRLGRMRALNRQEDVVMAVLRDHGLPLDPPPPPPPPTPPPTPPEPLHMQLP